MISMYIKDVSWEKNGPNLPDFKKFKISKLPVFHEAFQKVARNIQGFCSFAYFHMYCVAKFD